MSMTEQDQPQATTVPMESLEVLVIAPREALGRHIETLSESVERSVDESPTETADVAALGSL